jgi:hypothetical protein
MREILGKAKTVRELLKGVKYSIDYYQREYKVARQTDLRVGQRPERQFPGGVSTRPRTAGGRRLSPLLPGLNHHQQEGQHQLHRGWPAAPD